MIIPYIHLTNPTPIPILKDRFTLGPEQLNDLLAHFVRERIPERIVHAKGGEPFSLSISSFSTRLINILCYHHFDLSWRAWYIYLYH